MTDMGIKRSEMYGESTASPKSEKDYEKEVCYPCLSLDGPQAEMMGAPDLKSGEYVKQTVLWKVARREEMDVNGKKSYRLSLDLVKGSDLEPTETPDGAEESGSDESEDDEEMSPGLAFVVNGRD